MHHTMTRGSSTVASQTGRPARSSVDAPDPYDAAGLDGALRDANQRVASSGRTGKQTPARCGCRAWRVSSAGQIQSNRSRPSSRRGRCPVSRPASHTLRKRASSSAICAPELPRRRRAPDRRAGRTGCDTGSSGAGGCRRSRDARSGTAGRWNGPVATTTLSASNRVSRRARDLALTVPAE